MQATTATAKKRMFYPWDEWFASGHFVLREYREYVCLTFTMNNNIRATALRRGLKVSIHHSADEIGDVITVTVTGRNNASDSQ